MHDSTLPHSTRGDGAITECPPECPKHEDWKARRTADLESWGDVWVQLGDEYRDAFYGRRRDDARTILERQREHLRRRPPELPV